MEELKKKLEITEQSHLLEFYDKLNADEEKRLLEDLHKIDFEAVNNYFNKCKDQIDSVTEKVDNLIEPVEHEICGSSDTNTNDIKLYNHIGYEEIAQGKVAVLLLAGGQGTRLGVSYPKGQYNVGLPSSKTLYQLQAERILKVQEIASNKFHSLENLYPIVPWYIMTSEHTKLSTLKFFEENNFFGLNKENIIIFEQQLLPCMAFNGKIILESKCHVAMAPDGNGGLYRALKNEKILDDMERRKIQHLHVYGVDNILVKVADPTFIGFCKAKSAECGAKVVEKVNPDEAVGVICKLDGKYHVVEYSEITNNTSRKKGNDGRLLFNAGNIANHYFTIEFLKNVCCNWLDELKHHVAKKKIPYVTHDGVEIKPTKPNGIKMEKFVFDVFSFAKNFAVWQVVREDEFSGLKNADGADNSTPTTCRQMLLDWCRRQVIKAGGGFIDNINNDDLVCEISPLVSYNGEGLENIVKGFKFESPLILYASNEGRKNVITKC